MPSYDRLGRLFFLLSSVSCDCQGRTYGDNCPLFVFRTCLAAASSEATGFWLIQRALPRRSRGWATPRRRIFLLAPSTGHPGASGNTSAFSFRSLVRSFPFFFFSFCRLSSVTHAPRPRFAHRTLIKNKRGWKRSRLSGWVASLSSFSMFLQPI